MNTLTSQMQTAAVIQVGPSKAPHGTLGRRLVVVLLEAEEEAVLASRILALADTRFQHVLLFGICPDPVRQTELRRRLVTIAAFLREKRLVTESGVAQGSQVLSVEVRIEQGKDWIEKIRTVLQADDLLACYEEQRVGKQRRQLSDILSSSLESPIYVFSGPYSASPSRQNLLSQAASWLGSIGAIVATFLLQVQIVGAMRGPAQTILLILTLVAEVGVIWIWNSLFT